MAFCGERITGLSPIHETSDLDLSFLISQLSSVSGEITDRTLEELLRDAECQPPSLSWCRPKEVPIYEVVDKKSSNGSPVENTNLFKNALETLSEISTRVQEKLTLDEKSEPSATYRLPSNRDLKKQPVKTSVIKPKWNASTAEDSQTVRKAANSVPKKFTNQSTVSAAARLYGKRLVASKRQSVFVSTSKPTKPNGYVSSVKISNARKPEKSLSDLQDENNRLRLQIGQVQTQFNNASPNHSDETVTERLKEFEQHLSTIRETYQAQLEKFEKKIDELEKFHRKTVEHVEIQTENMNQVPNIDFDDLVLDANFVPWSQPAGNVSSKSQKTENTALRSCKSCSGFGNGEQRRLLNTIRKLQTELDIVKKINQRLETQQKNLKPRVFGRSVVRRHIGTQTVGLGACSPQKHDPASFEDIISETGDLKKKILELENEVKLLNEQKTVGLRLLQVKHEEEIEVLLEEKMQLSKKLEAVQKWNLW